MRHLKSYALMLLTAFVMFSCGDDYDDTALRNDVNDLKSRVEKLEAWCTTVNGQISSLQGLISALEANDYVTGVSPVTVDGKTGYTITFTKSEAITIFDGVDGKNGADGTTPVIGVDKFTDGLYYWTVKNGDAKATWMLDASGNKIRTTGDAGKTPKLSVAADTDGKVYWQVDGQFLKDAAGKNVPATGDKGAQGEQGAQGEKGDAVFAKVDTKNPDYVEFTLVGGEVFQLQRTDEVKIFDSFTTYRVNPAKTDLTLTLNVKKGEYTVLKAELTTSKGMSVAIVSATRAATEPWGVALTEPTFKADGTIEANGKVTFTFPEGTSEGDFALLKVLVIDNNGKEHASTRVIEYSTKVDVESIAINKTETSINVGETETLTVAALPAQASNEVTWSSSDAAIATVDADGKVTAVAKGEATITATSTENNEIIATCKVTVTTVALTKIELADQSVAKDGTLKLVPTFTPANASNKELTWDSSDKTIATIAADGTVTGLKVGTTTITATSKENGQITATCKVTVSEGPDFVISGYIYNNGYQPQWWHDGKMEALTGAAASVSMMAIAGNDVYIAGNQSNNGTYVGHLWKNGTKMGFTTNEIGAIAASGSDLYIGSIEKSDTDYTIKVQKNEGIAEEWVTLKELSVVHIEGMQVIGNDIYVMVYTNENGGAIFTTYIYKNKSLLYTLDNLDAPSMYVVAGHVYTEGVITIDRVKTEACVYKDGIKLHELSDGKNYDQAYGLFVEGDDVYVLRRSSNSTSVSLWKNGTRTDLTDKVGDSLLGFTVQGGKAYIYAMIKANNLYTVKQWCSADDKVTDVIKDLAMTPRAIVFR